MSADRRAAVQVLVSACAFGSLSIGVTLATAAGVSLIALMAWRYAIASPLLVLAAGGPARVRIAPSRAAALLLLGGGGQTLITYLSFSSLAWLSAAQLGFLFYTYPAWVALTQAVRGAEKLDARRATALALSFAGIGVMVGMPGTGTIDWRGVALALGAALVYGIYIPIMRVLQKEHPVAPPSAYSKIGASLAFLMLSVSDQSFTWRLSPEAWMTIGALAVFSTVLPSVFFLMGLIRLGPVRVAIVSTVEPFLTGLLAIVVLGQPLTWPTVVGGGLIIGAVVMLQFRRERVA